jgi:alkylation response protein AidB-like acyl-CoA dehydrogenase
VLDNWRTLGMRGTGSNDIVIENVEIQDATVSMRRPKGKWHRFFDVVSPMIWPLVMAAYLGVAESARDIAVAQAQKKRDDPIVQQLVGEMDTELANARMAWEQLVAGGAADREPSLANSDETYKRRTILGRALVRSVYLAMEVTGGGSFFRSVGLERAFRDIQGIRFHPMQERRQYQFSGRVALGLDPV